MANTYRLNIYSSAVGESESGYVEYSISPDYGALLLPGDVITVSGTAYCRSATIRCIEFFHNLNLDGRLVVGALHGKLTLVMQAGVATNFSFSCKRSEAALAALPAREYTSAAGISQFGFWTVPEPDPVAFASNYFGDDLNRNYRYLKYRLSPQVIAMDFERANAAGTWANDGQYLQCRALRIGKSAQAAVGDFTTARITSRSVDLTQAQLTAALTAEGYSEAKPGIFANFASVQGVTYTLTLLLGDAYDQIAATDLVMRSFARIDFAKAKNGGVAIGMFSTATDAEPKFEVDESHESFLYGGIHGVNNYRSGEVATGGHWIDGKPIYRYTYVGKPSGSGGQLLLDSSINNAYVDRVIQGTNVVTLNDGHYYAINEFQSEYPSWRTGSLTVNEDGLSIYIGEGFVANNQFREVLAIIDYTKK